MKKINRKLIVKKLDGVYSRYIRKTKADKNGMATCITCGKVAPWQELQCGHYFSRSKLPTRWDDDNCFPQCLTEESNLKLFNGKYKSISKVNVGDELWSFNENDYSLEKAKIKRINSFIPKELYEIEMEDGSIFYATSDHMVVANGKWVSVKSMLHNVLAYDILEL